MIYLIAIFIFLLAYAYGTLSTARALAKNVRSLNISKVGTGLADTENIYTNISRPMGVVVGALDTVKAYVFLQVINLVLKIIAPYCTLEAFDFLYSLNMMLIYGLFMLIGHCLPIMYRFKGGRGIFTYMGFFAYFSMWPVLISAILAWFVVARYRQIRFAQYMIVILPVILFQAFYYLVPGFRQELPPYFASIMLFNALFMGILNILVSKRLGEI